MTELSTVDVLHRARELIAEPEHWTQGAPARDRRGDSCDVFNKHAVSWCVVGVICRAGLTEARNDALEAFARVIFGGIVPWNEDPERTHAEVLAAFDRAIAAAEQRRG